MLHSLLVKDYMIGDHLALNPEDEVLHAIHTLIEHGLSGAPVADDNGHLIGFLSEKDCLKVALNASYFEQQAGLIRDYMSRNVVSVTGDSSLIDAIEIFLGQTCRCLPVVEGQRLIGQISRRDILKALEKLRTSHKTTRIRGG
ncbi:MAG: CBS domain-containing protein [Azoarcus sp.]|jgi:predicted transcriptional regulator|nr:CBS domain-containing protein [Azoarcus sp.]MDD2873858.1 CBS domain-containing protein [Azoarcus sp.]MDX9836951.1 CBS domain-containing protein [Azoarcus sp.]